jgi:hypothetical protein
MLKQSKTPITNAPSFSEIWGVVESISAGPPKTLGVKLQGSPTASVGLTFLGSYQPTVGDYVLCLKYGNDLKVIGTTSGVGMGMQIPFSFAVQGLLVASGGENTPPPFPMPVPDGQIVKITAVRHKILGGTSCNVDFQRNGSAISGLSGITINTTAASDVLSTPLELSNNDELGIYINSIDDAPYGLMAAFYGAIAG